MNNIERKGMVQNETEEQRRPDPGLVSGNLSAGSD